MARQSAEHIKNRARKLRASAARRVCPHRKRKAAYSEERLRRIGFDRCRWCGIQVWRHQVQAGGSGGKRQEGGALDGEARPFRASPVRADGGRPQAREEGREVGRRGTGVRCAKLICVGVDVRVKGRVVRLRVVARSIRRAVDMAGPLDDGGRARLVLPIDGERFFVDGRTRGKDEGLAEDVPGAPQEPMPRGGPRRLARTGQGRPPRGA